jgi:hypothetical protein
MAEQSAMAAQDGSEAFLKGYENAASPTRGHDFVLGSNNPNSSENISLNASNASALGHCRRKTLRPTDSEPKNALTPISAKPAVRAANK